MICRLEKTELLYIHCTKFIHICQIEKANGLIEKSYQPIGFLIVGITPTIPMHGGYPLDLAAKSLVGWQCSCEQSQRPHPHSDCHH